MEDYWRPARLTPGLESPEFARESGIGTDTFDYQRGGIACQ